MKILIIHASAGAGHQKAAEALFTGTRKFYPEHEVKIVDALDYTSPSFKKLYRGTYFFLISQLPCAWALFFNILDKSWMQSMARILRRFYNSIFAEPLEEFLREERFDYIFSTHFMPVEVCAALKRQGLIQSQLITVITDFDVHKIWLAEGVDKYTAASEWTKRKLKKLGVEEEKILVSGIPIHEKFLETFDIGFLKKKLGFVENNFTVLLATGSFGIGPLEEIIQYLFLEGFQTIVVCGQNKNLMARLTQKNYSNVRVFGLVDNMHELMSAADCLVTKPGGLSISEALVRQLPLIFFNPIPGQEAHNVQALASQKIGFLAKNSEQIVQEVKRLSQHKDAFLTAVKRTQELARPNAVKDILLIIK